MNGLENHCFKIGCVELGVVLNFNSLMPSSHFHGLDAGSVTVLIRDYPA